MKKCYLFLSEIIGLAGMIFFITGLQNPAIVCLLLSVINGQMADRE